MIDIHPFYLSHATDRIAHDLIDENNENVVWESD